MSHRRQPWGRLEIAGHRCRLQILDPQTALELEPAVARQLGDEGARLLVTPDAVLTRTMDAARSGSLDAADDQATAAVITTARLIARSLGALRPDARWVRMAFTACVLERFECAGRLVEDLRDWETLRLPAIAKWQVLAFQFRQTFGPLWSRKPYEVRLPPDTTGVKPPGDVPIAVQYADNLARQGHATSMREILDSWTPVDLIHVVENASFHAASERAQLERAREEGRRGKR